MHSLFAAIAPDVLQASGNGHATKNVTMADIKLASSSPTMVQMQLLKVNLLSTLYFVSIGWGLTMILSY